MGVMKCNNCGAPLELRDDNAGYVRCIYCGSYQQILSTPYISQEGEKAAHKTISDSISRQEQIYRRAIQLSEEDWYYDTESAVNLFRSIPDYKDSAKRLHECEEKLKGELVVKRKVDEAKKKAERRRKRNMIIFLLSFIAIPFLFAAIMWLIIHH